MRFIKKFFIFIFLVIILSGFGLFLYAHFSPSLEINNSNQIYLYDINENLVNQGSGNENWVSLEDISPNMRKAIISTEDKNFYKHFGFDFLRIAKAMTINIKNKSLEQGASTISQQYIKNMYLNFDKTWQRKFEEALLTLRLEARYSKDEILEGYLNTINFGQGNYGIENASNYYFNKSAKDLSLEEAIILAGIPKAPNRYNPISDNSASIKRAKTISKLMLKNNSISLEDYNKLDFDNISFYGKENDTELKTLMYYQDAVYKELESLNEIPPSLIKSGGLKIYTTLDLDIQKEMESNIIKYKKDNLQTASIIINPNNGDILALAGGNNYSESQFNRAINAKRQVGSSIKPFLYYAALENGMVSSSTFLSEPTTFMFSNNKSYSPANYNNKYANKNITMAAAIAYSDNIYAVKTHLFLGEETLVNTAKRLGLRANLSPVPSLALGTFELSMLDFATAYTTLASGGYRRNVSFIKKIEDMNGKVLYEKEYINDNVLNESYTFILNEMMTSTYNSSFIDYNTPTVMSVASKISSKYAIKTGSSGTDCWMIGYNPNALMIVWNGYDDNSELEVKDGSISKNIWVDTIENINIQKSWYDIPANVIGIPLNSITGLEESDPTKSSIFYFINGSEYNNKDTEYVYNEKGN